MIKLLNTLYVTSPDAYLSLEGETVVILKGDVAAARIPLHNLCSIVSFGYTGCSPALMGSCAARGIDLCFLTQPFPCAGTGACERERTASPDAGVHCRGPPARIAACKEFPWGKAA